MDKTETSADVFINEDGVLTKILSKLSLKDAVKTSVLSRRWRYIWTYLPNIQNVFCPNYHNLYMRPGRVKEIVDETVQIMDSVLKQHYGSGVETFRVDIPFLEKHSGSIDQWVAFAAAANTKELLMAFQLTGNKCYDFPFHLLFQQNRQSSIKCLRLQSCSLQVPAGIGCLRSLQTLEIQCVSIHDADFQNLVSTCVVMKQLVVSRCTDLVNMSIHQQSGRLKHLTVSYCPSLMSIDVQAEKLISFVYRGNLINFSFQDVSCITEGELSFIFDARVLDFVLMTLPNLLPQFQKLILWFKCVPELIRMPEMSCHRFEHLKNLTLIVNFVNGGSILFLITLLTLVPRLEKITLDLHIEGRDVHMEVPIHNIPSLAHLKEVEIAGFTASEGQLIFLRYLCHNASSLRSMRIIRRQRRFFWPEREGTLGELKRIVPPGLDVSTSL